eukprot:gene53-649_t
MNQKKHLRSNNSKKKTGEILQAHAACRTSFGTKVENCERKYGLVEDEEDNSVADSSGESQKENRKTPSDKYSRDVNPLEYMAATLKEQGLRDEDLIKA